MKVVGYARVSTTEQGNSGAGLAAQRLAIMSEIERRGWSLVEVIEDVAASGASLKRAGIQAALQRLRDGEADALVVAKLDRLSRSLLDFAAVMASAQAERWAIVALDLAVDSSTPAGEMMANVLTTFAQFERRLIGQRTRDALAVKRSQGQRLGRPSSIAPGLRQRILSERARGATLREIAAVLNAEGVATPRGGSAWRPSSLEAIVRSA